MAKRSAVAAAADAAAKQPIFRMLDEKHLASETGIMSWSPKMDLIAVANVQGEVALHRLSWQKVWTLAKRGDSSTVLSVAWRPDGKVLAIGYSSAVIVLCDTENKDVLHTHTPDGLAVFMQWTCEEDIVDNDGPISVFQDDSSTFLPSLPPLNKNFGLGFASAGSDGISDHSEGSKKLIDQKKLNILLVGTDTNKMLLYAFGIFPCLEYSMRSTDLLDGGEVTRISSAVLSTDFAHLFAVVEVRHAEEEEESDYKGTLEMLTFELPLLAARRNELFALSAKYGQLASLLGYVASTIQSVVDSWEDILLEIDTKLVNYAREKRMRASDDEETVADDFLDLLMFGIPSDELQKFLLHDLTEKGLKKLVHSIELSYSNIQKLVLKHLQNVSHAIAYHLGDVLGMSRWYDRFGVLGLRPEVVERSLSEAGAFVFKVSEVQQVIDQSMKNLKAFFRWVYVVILRLSQETVSGDITEITQQELHFVAQFLKDSFSFQVAANVNGDGECDDGATGQRRSKYNGGFNLERVGQYLRNGDLLLPPTKSNNDWAEFVESKSDLKDEVLLYKFPTQKSLIQQQRLLQEGIELAFGGVRDVTGQAMRPCKSHVLSKIKLSEEVQLVRQQWIPSGGRLLTAFCTCPPPCDRFVLVSLSLDTGGIESLDAVSIEFTNLGEGSRQAGAGAGAEDKEQEDGECCAHDVLDFQFYNETTMSVLLMERRSDSHKSCRPVLVQLPLKALDMTAVNEGTNAVSAVTSAVDGGKQLHGSAFQRLSGGMKAFQLVVSGPRHVVCVLFESKRRVRLFEMDIEEDEEEDVSASVLPDESSIGNDASDLRIDDDKENSI